MPISQSLRFPEEPAQRLSMFRQSSGPVFLQFNIRTDSVPIFG